MQFRFPLMLSLPLWYAERSLKLRGGIKLKPDCSRNEREQLLHVIRIKCCTLRKFLQGLGQFYLMIRPIFWSIAYFSSSQHAGAAKKRKQDNPNKSQRRSCVTFVVGGTIFLSDWAEILSVPLTSSWIYSEPTVYHCSVYSTGTWQGLLKSHDFNVCQLAIRWRWLNVLHFS